MNICSIILILLLSFFSKTPSYTAEGKATYYADRMQGHRTASGDKYDKKLLTAAHATLPFNTLVQVTNVKNGKSVVVKINDRKARNRQVIIDLSRAAAEEIDLIRAGIATVKIKQVEKEEEKQQDTPLAVSEAGNSSK
ncbi:septal ring lytic transglycosylase RlpA family protein [Pontibacter cellulosilyticus]|uniref:Probable endolytic peptidoglycan transglycosylase RlpA n=1 Tax=Pontibacter cellulosilyticus TaxID=1720253 RepID=A0A923N5L9_9BACT|nr:septal ring lytic transglycosylase RlpA family protein [Pontibacter cellulosilyticus]MBC5991337.1 septal ring lytic transglycosylase RlpA family protein [Pontibacter cellulosilyticus]